MWKVTWIPETAATAATTTTKLAARLCWTQGWICAMSHRMDNMAHYNICGLICKFRKHPLYRAGPRIELFLLESVFQNNFCQPLFYSGCMQPSGNCFKANSQTCLVHFGSSLGFSLLGLRCYGLAFGI